jgi:hypothetical protein
MNIFIEFLNSTIVERLFNKHTNKGLLQLIVALVLGYAGFSEKFIENMASYKWTFVESFLVNYKIYVEVLCVFFLLIAGFNIFRKEYSKIHIRTLEAQLKEKEIQLQIKKILKEIKDYEI